MFSNENLGVIYSSWVFEASKSLAKFGNLTYNDSAIMASKAFYSNLIAISEEYKEVFKFNSNRNCYHSSWINIILNNWYDENCK